MDLMSSIWQLLVQQVKAEQHGFPLKLSLYRLNSFQCIGGVLFTEDLISWHVPRRVTPLLDGHIRLVEMTMGINGQRLDKAQMAARGYSLSTTDFHIVVEIPVGSSDGYYKVGWFKKNKHGFGV